MALLYVKNLFLRHTTGPTTFGARRPNYNGIDGMATQSWAPATSSENPDIESQQSDEEVSEKHLMSDSASSVSKSRKFKIDARVISDAIIGLSDGLTVPFALTAGLSALGDTKVVIYGGMAELIAGAISMGLGGYLGAKSEEESYRATLSETQELITTSPETIDSTLTTIFSSYNFPPSTISLLTTHLSQSPHLVLFLMHFQHMLPPPSSSRATTCALTIAFGYFVGGFIPLLPYMFVPQSHVLLGLYWSIGIMIVALFIFGYVKTCFVAGWRGWRAIGKGTRGGAEMVIVGSLAAGAAMGLVVAFDHNRGATTGGA